MTPHDLIDARRPWLRDLPLRPGLTRARLEADDAILDRLVQAYRLATAAERDRGVVRDGPWSRIRSQHMGELITLLTAGRRGPLAEYLRELPNRPAGHGFFQGRPALDAITRDPLQERGRLVWIMDAVCGLAESLGLLGVVCPEAPPTIPVSPPTVEELVARIEAATGLPLTVPEVFAGLHGVAVGDRVVHLRSACAVYAALRIRDWLADRAGRSLADCTICEIGPGVGLVPAALGALGARRMLLVDLPELNAIQAYFLAQVLPGHRLTLFGEPPAADEPTVRIVPDFEFLAGEAPHCDLVFNQDSLPEIDLEGVRSYLDRIAGVTNYFFSINQETRVPVGTPLAGGFLPSMVRERHPLRRLERMPSWCRAGYLEEMFVSADPRPT
jgi:hypothetical protein